MQSTVSQSSCYSLRVELQCIYTVCYAELGWAGRAGEIEGGQWHLLVSTCHGKGLRWLSCQICWLYLGRQERTLLVVDECMACSCQCDTSHALSVVMRLSAARCVRTSVHRHHVMCSSCWCTMVSDFKHFWLRVLQESLLYTEHDVVHPSVGSVVCVMMLLLRWHSVAPYGMVALMFTCMRVRRRGCMYVHACGCVCCSGQLICCLT